MSTTLGQLSCEGKSCYVIDGKFSYEITGIQTSDNSCPAATGAIREEIEKSVHEEMEFFKHLFESAAAPNGSCKPPCQCKIMATPTRIPDWDVHLRIPFKNCIYTVHVLIKFHATRAKGKCVPVGIKKPPVTHI